MAVTKNPDGTYTLTDPMGKVIDAKLPASLANIYQAVETPAPTLTPAEAAAGIPAPVPVQPQPKLAHQPVPHGTLYPEIPLAGPETAPVSAPQAPPSGPAPLPGSPIERGSAIAGENFPVQLPDGSMAMLTPAQRAAVGAFPDDPQGAAAAGVASAMRRRILQSGRGGYVAPRPEQDVELGSARVEREDVPPEMIDAYVNSMAAQADVAQVRGLENEAANKAAAVFHAATAEKADQELAKLRSEQAQRQAAVDRQMAIIESRMNDVRAMAAENPVEKYWEQKGAFGTLMTKIGMALSTIGSTVARAPNVVVDTVNRELDREMAVQQMKIAGAYKGLDAEMTLLGQLQKTMLSPEAAVSATKALLAEQIASETKALAAAMNSESARTAALGEAAKISQQAAEYLIKAKQQEADTTTRQYKHLQATRGGYVGGKSADLDEVVKYAAKATGFDEREIYNMIGRGSVKLGDGEKLTEGAVAHKRFGLESTIVLPPSMRGKAYKYTGENYDKAGTGMLFAKDGYKIGKELTHADRFFKILDELDKLNREHPAALKNPFSVHNQKAKFYSGELKSLLRSSGLLQEAMTQGEVDFTYGPLSIHGITGALTTPAQIQEQIKTARGMVKHQVESALSQAYTDPKMVAAPGSELVPGQTPDLPPAEDYKPSKE